MGISRMKDEMHSHLWRAQQRWFDLKAHGATKHALKMEGLRTRGDMFYATRALIFTGTTRVAYERELKRFLDWAYHVRGIRENYDVTKKDFRAYIETLIGRGLAAKELGKVKSALVKFGALYGKYESFHAMSQKMGKKIREFVRTGQLAGPERPHVTPGVRTEAIERLKELDRRAEARSGVPRGYHLACELQKEAGLRAVEATGRLKANSLLALEGERGKLSVIGKGGRVREVEISRDLYQRLAAYFERRPGGSLAPRRAYLAALRRATLASGGRATGSHAHRRTSAVEFKNQQYRKYLTSGFSPEQASLKAIQDAVERLGHSRVRRDVAAAYLST